MVFSKLERSEKLAELVSCQVVFLVLLTWVFAVKLSSSNSLPLNSKCSPNKGWLRNDVFVNLNLSSLPPDAREDYFVFSSGRGKEELRFKMKEERGKISCREYLVLLWTLGKDRDKSLEWYCCMTETKELKFNSVVNSLNFLKTVLRT